MGIGLGTGWVPPAVWSTGGVWGSPVEGDSLQTPMKHSYYRSRVPVGCLVPAEVDAWGGVW